ncbi:YceI family protein [Ancylomarina salipaludis]|uniref:YceI family protein n=1 Tax=Ancylomarina salipaludis TaxID=2501299 RepID=A0A4Q1JRV6_9BACT|nr:YceI family protein [Ancylomarina salipaludis]RXQ97631.1 YceI family protein [Ancylomarina salipaludis]
MLFRLIHLFSLFLIVLSNSTIAQNSIHLVPETSSIRVFGTSNIHDWEMYVEFQTETSDYEIPNNSLKNLKNVEFKIEGNQFKSKESAMEKKAHKAMNLSQFPYITFLLKRITIRNSKPTNFNAIAIGTLIISGQSKDVKLPIKGNILGNRKMNITGYIDLKMSDFKIKPPTAFFGAISTANEIKIAYSIDFTSKEKISPEMLSSNLNP